jgi:hypothetical protein
VETVVGNVKWIARLRRRRRRDLADLTRQMAERAMAEGYRDGLRGDTRFMSDRVARFVEDTLDAHERHPEDARKLPREF